MRTWFALALVALAVGEEYDLLILITGAAITKPTLHVVSDCFLSREYRINSVVP